MADDVIDKLKELQKLDSEIKELADDVASFPARKKQREDVLQKHAAAEEALKKELTRIKLTRREKESELKTIESEIKRLQQTLSEVKTNKEYTSVQHEIAAQEQKKSGLEDEILLLMEKEEDLGARETSAAGELETERRNVEAENGREAERIEGVRRKLAGKEAERAAKLEGIDAQHLRSYERIRKGKKDGVAICGLDESGERCGGCFVRVPTDVGEKVKHGEIVQCENCSRILYR